MMHRYTYLFKPPLKPNLLSDSVPCKKMPKRCIVAGCSNESSTGYESSSLVTEVLNEFMAGNFVVKIGQSAFNQVDPDQAQEWMNAVRKRGGGIVGITKSLPALSRWALSFNLRSDIGKPTREMYDETKNMCTC